MGTISALLQKVQQMDTEQIIIDAVTATEDQITVENKEQLFDGLDNDGNIIGDIKPYASANYAFEKYQKNPIPGLGNPDLNDTGAFYAGMTIDISGSALKQYSTDSKNDELVAKYPGIYGLGPIAKKDYITGYLQQAVRQQLRFAIGI